MYSFKMCKQIPCIIWTFSPKKKKHLNHVIVIVFNCTCVYTWVYILVVGFFLFSFFFFFYNTQAQIETRTLGLIFVIWWTGLGLSQMCWADYEPSCAQKKNMGPTMHTHPYIQNIYVLYSKEQQRNSKKVNKTLGILRK